MLVLSRKAGTRVMIDDRVELKILKIKGRQVVLGFTAPEGVRILRGELTEPDSASGNQEEQP